MIVSSGPAAADAERRGWYSYLTLPEWAGGGPGDSAFEEVNGVRVEKRMGAPETRLANLLNEALAPFARRTGVGEAFVEMDFELPLVGTKRKPDVAFVSYRTWPRGRPITTSWWAVAPDLAAEVISPFELSHSTLAKVQEYFAAGVRAVWLVIPNIEQVYCYSSPTAVRILTRADDLTGDPLVPGFRLPLAELFPEPDPTPSAP